MVQSTRDDGCIPETLEVTVRGGPIVLLDNNNSARFVVLSKWFRQTDRTVRHGPRPRVRERLGASAADAEGHSREGSSSASMMMAYRWGPGSGCGAASVSKPLHQRSRLADD